MPVFMVTTRTGWAESRLVFEDSRGNETKYVDIVIDRPSDLAYIREKLDEIESAWRKQLDALKVTP